MIRRGKPDDQGSVRVTFSVPDDGTALSVVGSFNEWDPLRHPLKRRANGTRSVAVDLEEGREIYFRYLLDGGQFEDEADAEVVVSGGGHTECRLVV